MNVKETEVDVSEPKKFLSLGPGAVAYICNTSYSGSIGRRIMV
jgi:hypothetical protein